MIEVQPNLGGRLVLGRLFGLEAACVFLDLGHRLRRVFDDDQERDKQAGTEDAHHLELIDNSFWLLCFCITAELPRLAEIKVETTSGSGPPVTSSTLVLNSAKERHVDDHAFDCCFC